jgi:predicted AAA+ superfamily ATPase
MTLKTEKCGNSKKWSNQGRQTQRRRTDKRYEKQEQNLEIREEETLVKTLSLSFSFGIILEFFKLKVRNKSA